MKLLISGFPECVCQIWMMCVMLQCIASSTYKHIKIKVTNSQQKGIKLAKNNCHCAKCYYMH